MDNVRISEYITRKISKPFRAFYSFKQQNVYRKIHTESDGLFHMYWKGNELLFENSATQYELYELFLTEPYKQLDVKDKTVVDIGAGVGDTAIMFMLSGAKEVYAFEPDKKRYDAARKNLKMNNIKHVHLIRKSVTSLDQVNKYCKAKNMVLKSDCEGAEHLIFGNTSKLAFKKYGDMIMEFHGGYIDIKNILERRGYTINYSFSPYYSADFNGILYAKAR